MNALLAVTTKLDSSYNSEAKPVKAYAANVIFFINTSMKRRFLYTMVLFSLWTFCFGFFFKIIDSINCNEKMF